MANKHQLSLDMPDTNNVKILRFFDTSIYNSEIPVSCGTLEITPPGFAQSVLLEISKNFNIIVSACDLNIQTSNCDEQSEAIPDGIYKVRYSVAPNDKVFVEYLFLRTTQTMTSYIKRLCEIEASACEPSEEVKAQFEALREIKDLIDAAKVKVEYAHDVKAGMELFLYAQKKLNKYLLNPMCSSC